MSDLYEQDFYAWANEQAALLRAGKVAAADIENIAEEIESIARREKRELRERVIRLLLCRLKFQQRTRAVGTNARLLILQAQDNVAERLTDNPSLAASLPELLPQAYRSARYEAAIEMDMPLETFPEACPWTFDQAMQVTS